MMRGGGRGGIENFLLSSVNTERLSTSIHDGYYAQLCQYVRQCQSVARPARLISWESEDAKYVFLVAGLTILDEAV